MTARLTVILLCWAGTLAVASGALGDSPAPPSAPEPTASPEQRLAQFIRDMDSPDWRTRDAATIGLARDRKIVVERVTRRLDRHGLSLEQRLRLLRALETRLLLLPRGALGIRMRSEIVEFRNQNGEQIRGVEITELLPGMPAEEHLRVGDIIMSIGGERLDVASEVSSLIKQHWPGEVIELEIARDQPADHAGLPRRSTRLHLSMKLGSTAELDNHERGPGIQADRKHQLERTVRHYFSQYGPAPRPLSPPGHRPPDHRRGDARP